MQPDQRQGRFEIVCFALTLLVGFFDCWIKRFYINWDPPVFLDMSDAFFRGDWQSLINSHWAPGYPALIAFAKLFYKPTLEQEPVFLHVLQAFLFVGALASFSFFIHGILKARSKDAGFSNKACLAAGYALVSWAAVHDVLNVPGPDIIVAIYFFLVSGLMIRIVQEPSRRAHFVKLGAVMGLAYYFKFVAFAVSIFALGSLFLYGLVNKKRTNFFARLAISAAIFLVLAAPYISLISKKYGHLTFTDSGKLTLIWKESLGDRVFDPKMDDLLKGKRAHPPVQIHSDPDIYSYDNGAPSAFPLWFDPAYWWSGLEPSFHRESYERAWAGNLQGIFQVFFGDLAPVTLIVIFFTGIALLKRTGRPLEFWYFLLPVGATLGAYVFSRVAVRYITPFAPLVFTALLASVRLPIKPIVSRALLAAAFLIAFVLTIPNAKFVDGSDPDRAQWISRISSRVKELGLPVGTPVAMFSVQPNWVRMASLRCPVRTMDDRFFVDADAQKRMEIVNALKNAGIKLLVVINPVAKASPELPWIKLEGTSFSALKL